MRRTPAVGSRARHVVFVDVIDDAGDVKRRRVVDRDELRVGSFREDKAAVKLVLHGRDVVRVLSLAGDLLQRCDMRVGLSEGLLHVCCRRFLVLLARGDLSLEFVHSLFISLSAERLHDFVIEAVEEAQGQRLPVRSHAAGHAKLQVEILAQGVHSPFECFQLGEFLPDEVFVGLLGCHGRWGHAAIDKIGHFDNPILTEPQFQGGCDNCDVVVLPLCLLIGAEELGLLLGERDTNRGKDRVGRQRRPAISREEFSHWDLNLLGQSFGDEDSICGHEDGVQIRDGRSGDQVSGRCPDVPNLPSRKVFELFVDGGEDLSPGFSVMLESLLADALKVGQGDVTPDLEMVLVQRVLPQLRDIAHEHRHRVL